jgi:hypothetical protein
MFIFSGGLTGRKTNHGARRSLIKYLRKSDVAPDRIMKLTGQTNLKSVMAYDSPDEEEQAHVSDIVAKLHGCNQHKNTVSTPTDLMELDLIPDDFSDPELDSFLSELEMPHALVLTSSPNYKSNATTVTDTFVLPNAIYPPDRFVPQTPHSSSTRATASSTNPTLAPQPSVASHSAFSTSTSGPMWGLPPKSQGVLTKRVTVSENSSKSTFVPLVQARPLAPQTPMFDLTNVAVTNSTNGLFYGATFNGPVYFKF